MIGINLELITDIDMYLVVEKGLRGGVSYIANRYCKPNNKYLNDYDKNKDSLYLDANAFYAWAVSQLLPNEWLKRYKWNDILKKKKKELDILLNVI